MAQIDLPFSSHRPADGQRAAATRGNAEPESAKAKQLVGRAASALEGSHSVSAKICYQVDLFGNRWTGQGIYLEERSGPLPLVRLELEIPIQNAAGQMIQVCDGRQLWTFQKLLGNPDLSRVDLQEVAAALEEGKGRASLASAEMLIGLGGLPRLLRGLEANFKFTQAEAVRLGGLAAWQLHGSWKPEKLVGLLPEQKEIIEKGQRADLSKLPQHLPDQVLLLLGQSDLFPCRVDYLRAGRRRPLVSMLLSDVKINAPIDRSRFTYRPPEGLKPVDHTEALLERLREQEAESSRR